MVRPERLLAAAPLVLRFAPDRRRALRGSVQPGADAGLSNSACLFAGSSNFGQRTAGIVEGFFSSKENYGAPGEIRTPGLLVRSQALYPTELRARKGREYYHINWRAPFRCNWARKEYPRETQGLEPLADSLAVIWRRGRDYSSLRSSPLRGRPNGRYPRFVAATVS
jgi:hypothetical protein